MNQLPFNQRRESYCVQAETQGAVPGACGHGCALAPKPRILFLSFPTPIGNPASFSSRTKRKAKTLDQSPTYLSGDPVHIVEDDKKDKGTLLGPRPGANGFGSFCRNKRACPELVLSNAKDPAQKPRRPGAKPRMKKSKDPGSPIGVGDDRQSRKQISSFDKLRTGRRRLRLG